MNKLPFGLGAHDSPIDPRTIQHSDLVMFSPILLVKGGVEYTPGDIENQAKEGICTAISLIQNREKATGKKFSPEFQYLLQKKFMDLNWDEGSSIFSALKVGKLYGFLPAVLWTHTKEEDRNLPYAQYILKLQDITDAEILKLIALCEDKIPGYAQVDVVDSQAMAKAINESDSGILTRFEVGVEWFTPSWKEKDINPLRYPKKIISGHAINMSSFDFTNGLMFTLANTWSPLWCRKGCADIQFSNYRPTEAWTIVDKIFFTKDLKIGTTDESVRRLQQFLNTRNFRVTEMGYETDFFGLKTMTALRNFQTANSIFPALGFFGPLTRNKVNAML